MNTDLDRRRSRRAVLLAAFSAGVGAIASALARPVSVSAADGEAIVVGGEYGASSVTKVTVGGEGSTALAGTATGTAGVGVHGYAAQGVTSRGVIGETTAGQGVRGIATSGIGVRGYSASGVAASFESTTGFALQGSGRIKVHKCAGIATVAAGTKSVTVNLTIDVDAGSFVLATLNGSAGGTTTVHRTALNPTLNQLTIFLTANAANNVRVAWLVLN